MTNASRPTYRIDTPGREARASTDSAAAHFHRANALCRSQCYVDAVAGFGEALKRNPRFPEAYLNLGGALLELGETTGAAACFQQALCLRPDFAEASFNLGNLARDQDRPDDAVAHYRRAVAVRPEFAEAHNNLGIVLQQRDRLDEAITCYRRAIELRPDNIAAFRNLGYALGQLGHLSEAITAFRKALELQPHDADLHYRLGNLYKSEQRFDKAIAAYRQAIALVPEDRRAHYDLGNALKSRGDHEAARLCYERVLQLDPEDSAAWISLGNVLKTQDRLSEAATAYRRVLNSQPNCSVWELWIASLCPTVFGSMAELDAYRGRLAGDIERISRIGVRLDAEAVTTAGCVPPYNLQFHGRDDRPLKESFAELFRDCFPQQDPPVNTGRPRVGFVVTDTHEGPFLRYLWRVVQRLNSELFETVIFCSRMGERRIRGRVSGRVPRLVVLPSRLHEMVTVLREVRCDVLYHWEVGSDVNNYFLPFFRAAPVQCTGAGLPETSGIRQMDYFLSTDSIEPVDAERHYTERLIRGRGLLTGQEPLSLPASPKDRTDFGLRGDEHVYFCPQKLEKIHPDFDRLLAEILRRDPQGRIVLAEDKFGYAAVKLKARLANSLPDVVDRILFVPRLSMDDYTSLLLTADVLLDTIHYGGGMTAFDGFSLHKPIVTLPGEFVRGRYTAGLYRTLGITEPIVATPEEYVSVAVRLGTNRDVCASLGRRIREHCHLLFDVARSVHEYEELFERLIAEARG